MKKRIGSGRGLMLFELVIAIGFFAVFAAIFLHIVFSARQLSEKNNNLSHAIIAAENAAECFKAGAEPTLFYNEDWNPSDESSAAYKLSLDISSNEGVSTAYITVNDKNGGEVFSLTVKTLEEMRS